MNNKILAIIAHDSKKEDLIRLIRSFKSGLSDFEIVATRSTGQMIESRVGLPMTLVHSGREGGDMQIGAMIAGGQVCAVIFLRDPYTNFTDESIMTTLLRICDINEVPMATNMASATAVLHQLVKGQDFTGPHEIVADYLEEISGVHE